MMTLINGCTSVAHFFGKGSQRAIRAAHRVSALQQEAGDGGKTASPDANEMDVWHVSSIVSWFRSSLVCLDVHHEHKHECDDDRKVDARFAEQLWRHIEHHLVHR